MSVRTMESSWSGLIQQMGLIRERIGDARQTGPLVGAFSELVSSHVFYDYDGPNEGHLVHYTSWGSALEILEADCPVLRMYNYESTNDPQEGKLLRHVWREQDEEAKWLDAFIPEHEAMLGELGRSTGSTYGCAFSSGVGGAEDNLTFWRFYGNSGDGCSFKLSGHPPRVYRVRYLDKEGKNIREDDEKIDEKVVSWLGKLIEGSRDVVVKAVAEGQVDAAINVATGVRKILGGYRHLAKSSNFKDEHEWRMIEVAPNAGSIQYEVNEETGAVNRYIHGPSLKDVLVTGSAVTVGARVANGGAARAYIEYLLKSRGMAHCKVGLSQLTYRADV